ncbi:MAG: DUF63 family protein [Haloferacaceae archaeon]
MVLPAGFALPPLPYVIGLTLGVTAVGAALVARRPAMTERHALALVPWVLVGATAHVLYVVEALPDAVRPLAGTPAVYATVAVVAGAAWAALDASGREPVGPLAALGVAGLVPLLVGAFVSADGIDPLWPGVAVVVATLVAGGAWRALLALRPGVAVTGRVGPLVLFAHALDGVSTAVGVDVLGFGERTPLSQAILEFGAALPTAELFGSGWPFVAVKITLASVVAVALADLVRDEPAEGYALLTLVAAVGLGPAVHNLVLFTVAAP